MRSVTLVRLFIVTASLVSISVAQQPVVTLSRLSGPVTLDGISNEPAWEAVLPLPLTMQSPVFKGTPTDRTEIRVAYDNQFLYLSGRCYATDPTTVRVNSLTRDGLSPGDDSFGVVLDTFNDNENALAFITNPAGLREDWAVFNDAQPRDASSFPFNSSWSTFWDVAVVQNNEGWFVEMRIPFSSLRFEDDNGKVVMGMIVWRYSPASNEVVLYPEIPPKWDWGVIKPSVAQDVMLEDVYRRNPVYIAPYLLGGVGQNAELTADSSAYGIFHNTEREVGFDIKYSITSNLTLDITANTDFAQVEADDQQVNLTRFSLFFPEKRLFFQERSSVFDFSLGGTNTLFYSRTIGLSEEGPVRIFGGARLIGRMGDWDVGFLNMQTDKSEELPSENFGVLRLRRQVFNENSYAGGMVTSRIGDDGSYNYAYALDGIFRLAEDDYFVINWAQTFDSEFLAANAVTFGNTARARLQLERRTNNGFGYDVGISYAGSDFDPGVGFAQRVNYTRVGNRLSYGWYPDEPSPIFLHTASFTGNVFFRNTDGILESLETGPEWTVAFRSGSYFKVSARYLLEDLSEPFELSESDTIPIGRYTFYSLGAFFQTPWGNPFRISFNTDVGSFYDGSRFSFGITPTLNLSRYVEISTDYQFNKLNFSARNEELNTHLARLRVKATLNTQLSSSVFLQYNSDAHDIIINFRVRYNPREGNDLYLVYNEGLNTDRFRERPSLLTTDTRTVLLKYTYTFTF